MPLFTSAPESLCFLRLSAIGDVCHAVAAVQAVQRHWPETKITWIIGKVEAQLLEGVEGIEFIIFDKKGGYAGMKSVWKQLSGRRFDALVHMQLALRASLLTLGIKAKYKVGFNRQRAKEGQWLFTNKKIDDVESQHVLDSFLSFVEYLGIPKSEPKWNMPISPLNTDWVNQQIPTQQKVLVISPAASKDERNWLTERYAQFADYAIEQGYQVILCGSPSEREIQLGENIRQFMSHQATNLIGQTSLNQLLAVLNRADIVLAPDSGPAHMATTQGTPVIGLYAHSNPKRTGPYLNQANTVSVYEECLLEQYGKPSSELPWGIRVKGDKLMEKVSLQSVIEQLHTVQTTK
ncbi:glycosyltransferase family 9 protein [Vibrio sp. CK2-1]|uniref:glycosyltransferase family 9 protein n=1 Tax=Vibrio sp. CK2-1 TaxID=2912249 RepID=UPI001F293186|nr:glycosyltransferase family 9 protein [Vibrio sp. CK2-1]MCF7355387.1 glycosyltransferase family 9 protein [Vibrio sp. CK2-1]